MGAIPTVKIKNPNLEGSFIVINESDFDPTAHEQFVEPEKPADPKPAAPGTPTSAPKQPAELGSDGFPAGYRYEKAPGGYGYLYGPGEVVIEGPSHGKWQGKDAALMAAVHHAEAHAGA